MPQRDILFIVQRVLNELDFDPVDDINDTPEALQTANICGDVYDEIVAKRQIAQKRTLGPLVALSDPTKPTHMKLPDGVMRLESVSYNKENLESAGRKMYELVRYVEPDQFLTQIQGRDNNLATVQVVTDLGGTELLIANDGPPACWTSFDDTHIVFDSFDSDVDTTLQDSKSQCIFYQDNILIIDNNTIPDLPADAFPFLLAETKNRANAALNQEVNPVINAEAGRQRRAFSRNNWKANGGIKTPDMGRRARRRTNVNNRWKN